MPTEVGSMDVVMNYKDNGLKKGMDDSKKDFKEAKQSGKSMNEEMSRLSAVSVATGQAIFQVAAGLLNMFKNGLTSSPYLIGAFTRMKTDVTILFWKLTKYLKPAFDLLADAIHALTTGDWKGFIEVVSEAWQKFKDIVFDAWTKIKNWAVEAGYETLASVMTWMEGLYTTTVEWLTKVKDFLLSIDWSGGENGPWEKFKEAAVDSFKWIVKNLLPPWLSNLILGIGTWIRSNAQLINDTWALLVSGTNWFEIGLIVANSFWNGFETAVIPSWLKQGIDINEQGTGRTNTDLSSIWDNPVAPVSTVPSYETNPRHGGYSDKNAINNNAGANITIAFNAPIQLADGLDIDTLADTVSRKIADEQAWSSY